SGKPCGLCDVCDPARSEVAGRPRSPTARPASGAGRKRPKRARKIKGRRGGQPAAPTILSESARAIEDALRAWRLGEARPTNLPPFRILTDRVLTAIAVTAPLDRDALVRISGIGPSLADRYGRQILAVVQRLRTSTGRCP